MERIKSAHIIQTIFSYTDDILKFKLLSYSKKYQKQLNIDLFDYQVKFFDKVKMNSINNYYKYLYAPELLKKDLLKYNINIDDFKNYVKNYLVKYKEKFIKELNEEYLIKKNEINEINERDYIIDDYGDNKEIRGFQKFSDGIKLEIDINSPLFDIFYKSKLFGELFVIPIDFQFIERNKLKEDYITLFNKLNDINSNYSSICLKCYL